MILRPHGGAWLLISQPAHAALAGRLMREWEDPALGASPRRDAILLAIADHDNGWNDIDATLALDDATGRILDFIALPAPMRQQVWPRGVERLGAVPYAAALVAQHAVHVYSRYQGDAAWTAFFDEMARLRDEQLARAAPATMDDLLGDYQFVRTGDLISLAFCNDWREPHEDGFGRTIHFDGTRVTVEPDPFNGRSVDIQITGRELTGLTYPSPEAARAAVDAAPFRTVTATLAGR